jgi:hypothetical protein
MTRLTMIFFEHVNGAVSSCSCKDQRFLQLDPFHRQASLLILAMTASGTTVASAPVSSAAASIITSSSINRIADLHLRTSCCCVIFAFLIRSSLRHFSAFSSLIFARRPLGACILSSNSWCASSFEVLGQALREFLFPSHVFVFK